MAQENIAVPASTLESLAKTTFDEEVDAIEEGRQATAERLANHRYKALKIAEGATGFVSVNPTMLSTLCAHAEDRDARNAARTFLEQYKVW